MTNITESHESRTAKDLHAKCRVPGCKARRHSRGLCIQHYNWQRSKVSDKIATFRKYADAGKTCMVGEVDLNHIGGTVEHQRRMSKWVWDRVYHSLSGLGLLWSFALAIPLSSYIVQTLNPQTKNNITSGIKELRRLSAAKRRCKISRQEYLRLSLEAIERITGQSVPLRAWEVDELNSSGNEELEYAYTTTEGDNDDTETAE